jgi:hypothetical protein
VLRCFCIDFINADKVNFLRLILGGFYLIFFNRVRSSWEIIIMTELRTCINFSDKFSIK